MQPPMPLPTARAGEEPGTVSLQTSGAHCCLATVTQGKAETSVHVGECSVPSGGLYTRHRQMGFTAIGFLALLSRSGSVKSAQKTEKNSLKE